MFTYFIISIFTFIVYYLDRDAEKIIGNSIRFTEKKKTSSINITYIFMRVWHCSTNRVEDRKRFISIRGKRSYNIVFFDIYLFFCNFNQLKIRGYLISRQFWCGRRRLTSVHRRRWRSKIVRWSSPEDNEPNISINS